MNEKVIEYQRLLNKIERRQKIDPEFNGMKASQLIHESLNDALESLDPSDRNMILANQALLMDNIKGIGELSALELLAVISFLPIENSMRDLRDLEEAREACGIVSRHKRTGKKKPAPSWME